MTNYRRMMQEKLDGDLDEQRELELLAHLQKEPQAAAEQAQLERLHHALATAPAMRAPNRLAATIMARLAKTLEKRAQTQPMPEEARLALMLTVSVVQMAMMPLVVAASYMVLNTQYKPSIITRTLQQTIAMEIMLIDSLVILLEEIEAMIEEDPEMAPVAMSLVPVALMGMIDYIQTSDESS